MQLEVGKRYRNRVGTLVEILTQVGLDEQPEFPFIERGGDSFTEKGQFWGPTMTSQYDLIEEAP